MAVRRTRSPTLGNALGRRRDAGATEWWAGERKTPLLRRVLVWGLDVVVSRRPDGFAFHLLEANVYPYLLPNVPSCEALVEDMLRNDYLGALLDAWPAAREDAA